MCMVGVVRRTDGRIHSRYLTRPDGGTDGLEILDVAQPTCANYPLLQTHLTVIVAFAVDRKPLSPAAAAAATQMFREAPCGRLDSLKKEVGTFDGLASKLDRQTARRTARQSTLL
jgi:hypothetical protein